MLQKMRDGAQSLFAKILVGIICFVLAAFGFGAFNFFTAGEPAAASVNGDEITEQALLFETQRQKQMLRAQLGNADPAFVDAYVTPPRVLDILINQLLIQQVADDLDLATSESQYRKQITQDPAFQIDGQFSESQFRSTLDNLGYSPQSFRQELSRSSRVAQISEVYNATSFLTDRELRDTTAFLTQTRDIAYLQFDPAAFAEGLAVSEDEIENHYTLYADDFRTEEKFALEYVELVGEELKSEISVAESDVRASFETEIQAVGGDRRRGAHIVLNVSEDRTAAQATTELREIKDRIDSGEAFDALAKEISEDVVTAENGGDLGFLERGVFPYFDQVIDELALDGVSEPFETQHGVHIMKLLEIEALELPTFEERREDLENALIDIQVTRLFEEKLTAIDRLAFERPESLQPIVEDHGLTVKRVDDLSLTAGAGIFLTANVLGAVLDPDVIDNGNNSPAVLIRPEHAVVARLAERTPSRQSTLEDVREEISQTLIGEKSANEAANAATQAVESLEADTSVAEVASTHGLEWTRAQGAFRSAEGVPEPVLRTAFSLTAPAGGDLSIGETTLAGGVRAVVVVSNVVIGDYGATTDADRTRLTGELTQSAGQRDMQGFMATIREDASIRSALVGN